MTNRAMWKSPYAKVVKGRIEKAKELKAKGLSNKQISERLGMSVNRVAQVTKEVSDGQATSGDVG